MSTAKEKSLSSELYTEEYFLTACEGYEEYLETEGRHLSRRLGAAFQIAEIRAGMRILDVGCGRGEILRHCMQLGTESYGVDYAEVAAKLTLDSVQSQQAAMLGTHSELGSKLKVGVCRSDAKRLPFSTGLFDRVLMFDVVEHLYPWELHEAMLEAHRVLKPDGRFIIHTAPNRWYDAYAYPWVRRVRTILGEGTRYPQDPRAITPVNQDVHVNEQDMISLRRALEAAGFKAKVWLDSPPQARDEGVLMALLRQIAFGVPPFRWFFEREVFAVAWKGRLPSDMGRS